MKQRNNRTRMAAVAIAVLALAGCGGTVAATQSTAPPPATTQQVSGATTLANSTLRAGFIPQDSAPPTSIASVSGIAEGTNGNAAMVVIVFGNASEAQQFVSNFADYASQHDVVLNSASQNGFGVVTVTSSSVEESAFFAYVQSQK